MALSNHERVQRLLEVLRLGLAPYFEREMTAAYGETWQERITEHRSSDSRKATDPLRDVYVVLRAMGTHWNEVFAKALGRSQRSLVFELQDIRNRWAHQDAFSSDDTYRAMDTAHRLLEAIGAPDSNELERQKQEFLRQRYDEQSRTKSKPASAPPVAGNPEPGLPIWRTVVMPHPDVATGRFQQAEFAADLAQVQRNEGAPEYQLPREFFARTFVTEGLKRLLVNGLMRLNGSGGDPVVELQTNFGGGKTHSMLALFHLFSGARITELPGLEGILAEAAVTEPPKARRAALVGTAISPGQPSMKPDGTVVNTLWGELAWQLGGKQGYSLVAQADTTGTSPGDALDTLFKKYAPCLVLIDEWVAYARQLFGKDHLPGGSFDAHFSFAQALTESAKRVPKVQVVLSIPASDERTDDSGNKVLVSDVEIGGEGGRAALERLKNVVGRTQSPWRPASARESFEIVRRRLFQPIESQTAFKGRDSVVRAFLDMYRSQVTEFPPDVQDAEYRAKLESAYPIHPELFERLYTDWGSLDRFQRTRGVLRLMAAVIHALWQAQDASLLITPATVPIHEPTVQDELTRYLEDHWRPVIERDIDGGQSVSFAIDREKPNLGRYSACRRVARTVYIGSAPNTRAATRGIDEKRVRLGCVQPGESTAIFGDALRALSERANHLYPDGSRYWFSPQPSVARMADERALQLSEDDVHEEILTRLRTHAGDRGDFSAVHPAPDSANVADEREARLVLLGPAQTHRRGQEDSPARQYAQAVLDTRGSVPRLFRNTIVFLAPDAARLADLDGATRRFLAWKGIHAQNETLNLDPFQRRQAESKIKHWDEAANERILETWHWLFVPMAQRDGAIGSTGWTVVKVPRGESLAPAAAKKLRADGGLQLQLGPSNLRLELDRVPLWQGNHVSLKQLSDFFAQYLYLPRLKSSNLLAEAAAQGIASPTWIVDTFAYAESFDEGSQRYRGLVAGRSGPSALDPNGLLVRSDVAERQLRKEAPSPTTSSQPLDPDLDQSTDKDPGSTVRKTPTPTARVVRRFHGSASLDPTRMARDAGRIAEEVVQHLASLVGANVEVTLEIHADVDPAIPERTRKVLSENCRVLKFRSSEFSE